MNIFVSHTGKKLWNSDLGCVLFLLPLLGDILRLYEQLDSVVDGRYNTILLGESLTKLKIMQRRKILFFDSAYHFLIHPNQLWPRFRPISVKVRLYAGEQTRPAFGFSPIFWGKYAWNHCVSRDWSLRAAHNPEAAGSSPAAATIKDLKSWDFRSFLSFLAGKSRT